MTSHCIISTCSCFTVSCCVILMKTFAPAVTVVSVSSCADIDRESGFYEFEKKLNF